LVDARQFQLTRLNTTTATNPSSISHFTEADALAKEALSDDLEISKKLNSPGTIRSARKMISGTLLD
jgi:hypothetical protein